MSLLRRRMMMAVGGGSSIPDYSNYRGVYIEDVDGYLYTEDEWDGSKTANGIAVLTDNCRFVIAKQDASSSDLRWGGYGKIVPDIVTSKSSSTAVLDYDGAGNTPKIIEYLAGTNDGYVDGAPAAEACAAFTFPNGKKGYLPALGEWKTAYNNKTAVESAMTLIGGAAIQTNYYWSSTQYYSNYSWGLYWDRGNPLGHFKYSNYYVRAFAALKSDEEESGDSLFPATLISSKGIENIPNYTIAKYFIDTYPDMVVVGNSGEYTPITEDVTIQGSNYCDGKVVGVEKWVDGKSLLFYTENSISKWYALRVFVDYDAAVPSGSTNEFFTD